MDRFLRFNRFCLVAVLSLGFLAGCASSPQETQYAADGPLTPLPHDLIPQDPEDHVLDAAVQEYLKLAKAPLFSRYDFTRVDLDNDGRRDALVLMKGPHNYWCDANGCSLIVFKAQNDSFNVASEIFPVRGPMYVSNQTSAGWKNLIVRVSGQSYAKAKDVAMRFDGERYPRNPFFLPEAYVTQDEQEMRLFP